MDNSDVSQLAFTLLKFQGQSSLGREEHVKLILQCLHQKFNLNC